MKRDHAKPVDTSTESSQHAQFENLQRENAKLRAQLVAMQQLALAPRETVNLTQRRWLVRSMQLVLILFGVAAGMFYARYSDSDVARGMRDGYRDAAPPSTR